MHVSKLLFNILISTASAAPIASRATTSKCSPVGIAPGDAALVTGQFLVDRITPDLIERIFPTVQVNAVYATADRGNKAVQLGTYFTTTQTTAAPTLTFSAEPAYDPAQTKYTYFLVDPDVPQNGSPAQVNFLHWMVSNAQPSCISGQSPTTVVAYQALTPASTTQHRYTFLVYRQPAGFDATKDAVVLNGRTPFDLNDYTQNNGLVLVGGNFLKEAITNGLVAGQPFA